MQKLLFTAIFAILFVGTPYQEAHSAWGCFNRLSEVLQKLKGFDRAYFRQIGMIKEIQKTATRIVPIKVPIKDLLTIHGMEGVAVNKIQRRAEAFKTNRDEILRLGSLTIEEQQRLAPSKGNMRVAQDRLGRYILFDGNGRLKAIKLAFEDQPNLLIEVELLETNSTKVLDDLDWIRKKRGLTP